jgi:hypothetical protein
MSWATCYSGSNNIHFDYPPLMNDGRAYAGFLQDSVVNEKILQQNNIETNFQYRQFLTQNADTLIRSNQLEACTQCGNAQVWQPKPPSQCHPFLYQSPHDGRMPYGYENSDLKNIYLSRAQLESRMVAPMIVMDPNMMETEEQKGSVHTKSMKNGKNNKNMQ